LQKQIQLEFFSCIAWLRPNDFFVLEFGQEQQSVGLHLKEVNKTRTCNFCFANISNFWSAAKIFSARSRGFIPAALEPIMAIFEAKSP
jgi:hypothetical protein